MKRELMASLAAGDNPLDAARRMLARVEGEFNGGLTRAVVIARTEMLDATRAAALEQRKANTDILAGWIWLSQLDTKTCPSCWSMHGSVHAVDEPGPLDHHQGRCASLPKTKSAEELGLAGGDIPGLDPTRADAEARFNALPERVQREILGPARYEAWKAGHYPIGTWSRRVEHFEIVDGKRVQTWRDSFHTSPAPKTPADGWSRRIELRDVRLGARGTVAPPARRDIPAARIAPDGERGRFYDPTARETALWWEEQSGAQLWSVRPGEDRSPDAVTTDQTIELKRVSNSKSSVQNQVRKGRTQSTNIVLDGRDQSIQAEDAEAWLRGVLGMYGQQLDSVTFILDRAHLYWAP